MAGIDAEMREQDPLTQIDDETLALRMMEGDHDALRTALRVYGPKVKGYLRQQFGATLDDNERDYVFQTSLIKFWKKIDTYDTDKGSLRGWWIRIARNTAIDHIRGKKSYTGKYKAQELDDPADDHDDCSDVELVEDSKERRRLDRVHEFICNKLVGDEQIVALNCFAIGGDPDIVRLAAKLGKPRGYVDTVKSKVKKKIVAFILALEGDGGRKETK